MKILVGRTAFVDLSNGSIRIEETPQEVPRTWLGGRGANMAYLNRLLPAGADPLGPENVLIFGMGLLTGLPVPNGSRMSVSARSPESDALGDANMGGHFPAAMRRSGFDRVIVTGKAAFPVFLLLAGGELEVRDARPYWGLDVPATQEAVAADLGQHVRAAVIGPAGEHLVRFAAVMNGRKNAAGRGGLGAVMGSKRLKAVVAAGGAELAPVDASALAALRKEYLAYLHSSKIIQLYGKVGTALLYDPANALGALRTKNGQLNQWSPALNAAHLDERVEKMTACWGCTVHCRHVNRFGGEGPDFVTTALLGPNSGVDDLDEVIRLGKLCNDLGLDTASAGTLIPWALELYERGIIGERETDGPLVWGDAARIRSLLEDIACRRGFGDVLAESAQAVRLGKLPPRAADYLIAVKNLPQSDGHDPRYVKSFALGIATASRGADHLRNRPTIDILGLPASVREEVYGAQTGDDVTAYGAKEAGVAACEDLFAVCDSLGICRFVCQGWNSPKLLGYAHFAALAGAAAGVETSPMELREAGRRVADVERLLNEKLGLGRADDTLPRRYFEDPMPGGNTRGHRIDRAEFEQMLTSYYRVRGWDEEGRVPAERRAQLERALPG